MLSCSFICTICISYIKKTLLKLLKIDRALTIVSLKTSLSFLNTHFLPVAPLKRICIAVVIARTLNTSLRP